VQHADLGVVERRRRLVHDQDLGVVRQGLGDLDHLLRGDGEVTDDAADVERQPQALDQGRGLAVEPALVDEDAADPGLLADRDVLRHREVGHEVELLVDDADPGVPGLLRAADLQRLPVHREVAGVRGVDAGEQLHQRRLAGAVLADDGEHLVVPQLEVHVGERLHAGEALADPGHLEQGGRRPRPGRRIGRRIGHRGSPPNRYRSMDASSISVPAPGATGAR
jgi:hypothetical protein